MKHMIAITVACVLLVGMVGCTTTQKGALGGATLGGLAGGIIGHNNDGKTAEGAAIGAAAGGLLGGLGGHYLENEKDKAREEGYEAGRREAGTTQSTSTGVTKSVYQSDYK